MEVIVTYKKLDEKKIQEVQELVKKAIPDIESCEWCYLVRLVHETEEEYGTEYLEVLQGLVKMLGNEKNQH